jgi:L,D-peptidoglycan transpeptidase YkuD (ErfK/YbiS/YcfS/YnhG family)
MSHRFVVYSVASRLFWPGGDTPCALGKNGICGETDKREGDGRTPLGTYALRAVYYRPDRAQSLLTGLPQTPLAPDFGWCDASTDPLYNQFVRHPYAASAEHLWRDDGLYDLIVVLGHNDSPAHADMGSAIFLHCCTYDADGAMKPTLGCVAVPREALIAMLHDATPDSEIAIY